MNPAFNARSPDLVSANVSDAPRKKSLPPPLPPRASAPDSITDFPTRGIASLHPVVLSPATAGASGYHRLNGWAELILIGAAALFLTPILIGSHRQFGGPSTLHGGGQVSTAPIVPSHQAVELDEVLIVGTLFDEANNQENVHFDRAAALSAIGSAAAGSRDCGPDAAGPVDVLVTFAPSGETSNAEIEDGPLLGTPAGSCVARSLRRARVHEFDGERETVRTSIALK